MDKRRDWVLLERCSRVGCSVSAETEIPGASVSAARQRMRLSAQAYTASAIAELGGMSVTMAEQAGALRAGDVAGVIVNLDYLAAWFAEFFGAA